MESEIEEVISEEEAISLLDQATQNDQAEFKNAFDVLKFEGRRWNLLKSMKSFPFVMMILLVIGQVSWGGSQIVEEMRSWIGVMSVLRRLSIS